MTTGKLTAACRAVAATVGIGIAVGLCCCPLPASAQSIGKASAIKNQVQGIRSGATRSLASGGAVYSDDTVKSGSNSLAQLLFLDQTTFTVAANSQAVLNRVYRGKKKTGVGKLIMRAVTGAFRFVSGVQNPSNYQLNFPQGYITVRGTIVDILAGAGHSIIIVDEGAITVHVYATGANYDVVAGKMLIVHSGGRTDGPMTMDATLMRADNNIPFPLFGSVLWPGQQQFPNQFEAFDTRKDLNDILNASRSSSSTQPIVTTCPSGYFLSSGGCTAE